MTTIRLLCGGIAAALLLPALSPGQAPRNDLVEQQRQLLKVAADKMEAQVADSLAEARKLAALDPARALSLLKRLQGQLEADTALTEARRTTLLRTVKDRIQAVQGNGAARVPKGGDRPSGAADDEQRVIAATLELIEQFQRDGKTAEAARLAAELARKYPDNLAVKAAVRTTATVDQIKAGRTGVADTDRGFVGTLTHVDKAAIPPAGDIELPKDWAKKVAMRKDINQPLLTAKEQAILKALNSTIKPDYKNAGLFDVIDDLAQKLHVTFVLDKASLADLVVTSDTQVNLVLPRGVTARTALRKILGDVGLTYVIKNETVQIVTPSKAKEMMVTRTYYIGGLLAGGPFADAGIRFNPWFDQLQVMQNVNSLIALIQGSIEPDSWQANGGTGSITFYAPTMSLIIRQSAEVHGMIGGSK